MPISLAMLRRPRLLHVSTTHNQGVHVLDIFISGGIFGAAKPSIFLNALFTLLNSTVQFIRRRLLSKGFNEVFMNFLGRHSFFAKYMLTALISSFFICKCVAPSSVKSALHKQPSMTACFSHSQCHSIRSND